MTSLPRGVNDCPECYTACARGQKLTTVLPFVLDDDGDDGSNDGGDGSNDGDVTILMVAILMLHCLCTSKKTVLFIFLFCS